MTDRTVEIELHHHYASDTPAAYRVSPDGDDDSGCWLPKSECARLRRKPGKDPVYLFEVPVWLADDRGLQYDD